MRPMPTTAASSTSPIPSSPSPTSSRARRRRPLRIPAAGSTGSPTRSRSAARSDGAETHGIASPPRRLPFLAPAAEPPPQLPDVDPEPPHPYVEPRALDAEALRHEVEIPG